MLCGTPVIAFKRCSMPELIKDNKTGFLVSSINEAVKAIDNLSKIDRKECRKHALANFSKEKMVEGYCKVYTEILERRSEFLI